MKRLKVILVLMVLLLEPWCVSLIRCEILTRRYCSVEIIETCKSWSMAGQIKQIKILDYSPYSDYGLFCKAYVKEEDGGSVYYLIRNELFDWEIYKVDTIWAKTGGNADGFIWPYIR